MLLKSFFVKLGMDVDSLAFTKGELAARGVAFALGKIGEMARFALGGLGEALIGFNANAEAAKLGLAGVAGMNLKLPFEEAKRVADELYAGLQEDAAKTPAETTELVDNAQEIAGAFLAAGKNMTDLRKFTVQATVAAKMLRAEGTFLTDIKQAIQGRVGIKDAFAASVIKAAGLTVDKFNALTMEQRADAFARGLDNPTIRAALLEYENSWAGVTSTLTDNLKILAGAVGEPLFKALKGFLKVVGDWVAKNRVTVTKFFLEFLYFWRSMFRVAFGLVQAIAAVVRWFYSFGAVIGTVLTGVAALTVAMALFGTTSTLAGLQAFAAWVLAALPVLAMVALLALAVLIAEDVIVGMQGGQSLIFELWDAWKGFLLSWLSDTEGDGWLVKALKQAVLWLVNFDQAFDDFVEAWKQIFLDFVEWVGELFADLWAGVKSAAAEAISALNPLNWFGDDGGGPVQGSQFFGAPVMMPSAPAGGMRASTSIGKLEVHSTNADPEAVARIVVTKLEERETVALREAYAGVEP